MEQDASSVSGRLVLTRTVARESVNGESVLLDLANDRFFTLDAVAARSLDALLEAHDLAAAVAAMKGHYPGMPVDVLAEDLKVFAQELLNARLVELKKDEERVTA